MATPSVTCYSQPGKLKSWRVLEAFAQGAGARVCTVPPASLMSGDAAFFGTLGLMHLLREAQRRKLDWYYGDNSFFDVSRQTFFRFAKNDYQIFEKGIPSFDRLAALGLRAKLALPGRHVLVVEQSEEFLYMVGAAHWLKNTTEALRKHTDREIRVRRWNRNKKKASVSLQHDLKGAWALVTHMSAAANEALLAGIPVFVTGPCAATPLSSGSLSKIESPFRATEDEVNAWAAGLASRQWTLDELRDGSAWRTLNGL